MKSSRQHGITTNNSGMVIAEFAFLLPILLVIMLGAIEFGFYFVRDEIVDSTVSNISLTLQRNPNYFNSMTTVQQNALIASWGSGLIKFSPVGQNTGSYICINAYANPPSPAQASTPCTSTYLTASNPNGPTSTVPYYIVVTSNLKKGTITPLGNFIPAIKNIQVSQNTGAVQIGNMLPPVCKPWQNLIFDGTSFTCQNVPYVIAQGIAHPSNVAGNGSFWETNDQTYPASAYGGGWHNSWTLCHPKITFTIPAGLPPGEILPQATLIYPYNQPNGESNWHQWVVSFTHWYAPTSGGNGSFDICIANGGNWGNSPGAGVNSEHVSWVVTFYPASSR